MAFQKSHRLGYPIYFNADGHLLGKARVQRKAMTPSEKRLWGRIKKEALGVKFRRQQGKEYRCYHSLFLPEI